MAWPWRKRSKPRFDITVATTPAAASVPALRHLRAIGALRGHFALHRRGRDRAGLAVDIVPVGRDTQRNDLGAQLPQNGRRDLVGGAVGAIDHDFEAIEPQAAREASLDEFDV